MPQIVPEKFGQKNASSNNEWQWCNSIINFTNTMVTKASQCCCGHKPGFKREVFYAQAKFILAVVKPSRLPWELHSPSAHACPSSLHSAFLYRSSTKMVDGASGQVELNDRVCDTVDAPLRGSILVFSFKKWGRRNGDGRTKKYAAAVGLEHTFCTFCSVHSSISYHGPNLLSYWEIMISLHS